MYYIDYDSYINLFTDTIDNIIQEYKTEQYKQTTSIDDIIIVNNKDTLREKIKALLSYIPKQDDKRN